MKKILITGVAGLLGSRLADWILENTDNEVIRIEPELLKLGPDNFSNTEGDTLTGRFCYYNALDNNLVGRILIPKLISLFGLGRWYQAWFNTFREGECIKSHVHNDRSHPTAINRRP